MIHKYKTPLSVNLSDKIRSSFNNIKILFPDYFQQRLSPNAFGDVVYLHDIAYHQVAIFKRGDGPIQGYRS